MTQNKSLILWGVVCIFLSLAHADLSLLDRPLRQWDVELTHLNDSLIGGDDDWDTHSENIMLRMLFEQYGTPTSHPIELIFFAHTNLSAIPLGESDDGKKIQYPRETNLLSLDVKFGRETTYSFGFALQDINFKVKGRGFATLWQIEAHELFPNSRSIINLDLKKDSEFSVIFHLGFGGEYSFFEHINHHLLLKWDTQIDLNFTYIEQSSVTSITKLQYALSDNRQGKIPSLALDLELENLSTLKGVNSTLFTGLEWNIKVADHHYIAVQSGIMVPIYRGIHDPYDQVPEAILGISVSFKFDGWD